MTWTYVRTLDSFTLAKEKHIICIFWKWRKVLLRTSYGLQWYNFFTFIAGIKSFGCQCLFLHSFHLPAKTLHHRSFLPFSLLVGRISGTFSVSSNSLYVQIPMYPVLPGMCVPRWMRSLPTTRQRKEWSDGVKGNSSSFHVGVAWGEKVS